MNTADVCRLVEPHKARKRRGRGNGSGLGKQSGRGQKGACARTGFRRRWFAEGGQMPLYRRLPKKGFSNARFKVRYDVVNVGDLAAFEAGTCVTLALVAERGLVKIRHGKLKILGGGSLTVPLDVRAASFSAKAREKIVGAGGKAEVE
jgi:large subunit ribosomal protein L15